jgi:uncharacterized membrane protein YgcG
VIFDIINRRSGSTPEEVERVRALARAVAALTSNSADPQRVQDVQAIAGYVASSPQRAAHLESLLNVKLDSIAEDRASQPAGASSGSTGSSGGMEGSGSSGGSPA